MYSRNISRGPQKYAVDQEMTKTDHMSIGTRQNKGDNLPRQDLPNSSGDSFPSFSLAMQQA